MSTRTIDEEAPAARPSKPKGTSAPVCKVCGAAHWFKDPHVFAKGSGKPVPAAEKKAKLAVAREVIANPPQTKRKNGRKRK